MNKARSSAESSRPAKGPAWPAAASVPARAAVLGCSGLGSGGGTGEVEGAAECVTLWRVEHGIEQL